MRQTLRPLSLVFPILLACLAALPPMATESHARPWGGMEVYPPAIDVTVPKTVGDGTAFLCSFRTSSLISVTVTFLERSITVPADKNGGEAHVLLPVPLDHPDADARLAWEARFSTGGAPDAHAMPAGGTVTVKIRKRAYPVQKLTVAPRYVTPGPALKERIERERQRMGAALATWSGTRHWSLPLARPVPGAITSLYGMRRVFNGQPRAPHRGLDFRGAASSPITAAAAGTVVLTGDFYYAGKFVVIDHGLGVTSISMHMSEIIARQGQTVAPGDAIGLVGSTGRSTGPHLHFGVSVLGQSIDAMPLLDLTDEDKAVYAAMMQDAPATPRKKSVKKTAGSGGKKSGSAPIPQSGKQAGQKEKGKTAVRTPQAGTDSAGPDR